MIRIQLATAALALAALGAAPTASAFYAVDAKATVIDHVTAGAGTWTYGYSVQNSSSCFGNCGGTIFGEPVTSVIAISAFSVPYFDDGGIAHIASPTGWTYAVSDADSFNLGAGAGTLTWSTSDKTHAIALGSTLGGFGYDSAYGPGKGPFQAVLRNGESFTGDPAVPLSPHAAAAGLQPMQVTSPVPEPQPMLMLLAGIGMVAATRGVRRTK